MTQNDCITLKVYTVFKSAFEAEEKKALFSTFDRATVTNEPCLNSGIKASANVDEPAKTEAVFCFSSFFPSFAHSNGGYISAFALLLF